MAEIFHSPAMQYGEKKKSHILGCSIFVLAVFKSLWFENGSKESNDVLNVIQHYSVKKCGISKINNKKHALKLSLSIKCRICGQFLLATVRKIAFPQEEYGNILVCLKN